MTQLAKFAGDKPVPADASPDAPALEPRSAYDLDTVPIKLFIKKLEATGALTAQERDGLAKLSGTPVSLRAGEDLIRRGDYPVATTLMVSGFMARYKLLSDGRRQFVSFHIPGDIPDLQSLFIDVSDHTLGALVPTQVLTIPHESTRALLTRQPKLAKLLWRETLIDGSIFREWITNVGRRSAVERVANLLCEMMLRMRAVGLNEGYSYHLPLNQTHISDALGLSLVSTNRSLRRLHAANLIDFTKGVLSIVDWPKLAEIADFNPDYLHYRTDAGH